MTTQRRNQTSRTSRKSGAPARGRAVASTGASRSATRTRSGSKTRAKAAGGSGAATTTHARRRTSSSKAGKAAGAKKTATPRRAAKSTSRAGARAARGKGSKSPRKSATAARAGQAGKTAARGSKKVAPARSRSASGTTRSGASRPDTPQQPPRSCSFEHAGQVRFCGGPGQPSMVMVRRLIDQEVMHRVHTAPDGSFSVKVELPPGRYQMRSEIPDDGRSRRHWDAEGPDITVTDDGRLDVKDHDMCHERVMIPLSPKDGVVVSEPRPVLRWAGTDGAAYYAVRWFARDSATGTAVDADPWYRTTWTEYTFPRNLVPGCDYEWQVCAYDSQGCPVARHPDVRFRASPPDPSEPHGYWD